MSEQQLKILSVNTGKRREMLTALLQLTFADILLIQEPAWSAIIPERSDMDPEGKSRYGEVCHPKWTALAPLPPYHPAFKGPHVMIYCRTEVLSTLSIAIVPSFNTYHSLMIDLAGEAFSLRVLNFYHHVDSHHHQLDSLLHTSITGEIPTLVAGDFNTASPLWSLAHTRPSAWSHMLEDWFEEQNLLIINPDLSPTWRNLECTQNSVIDLMLVNSAKLAIADHLASCAVAFEWSYGSDHAALLYSCPLIQAHSPPTRLPGWKVDPLMKDNWCETMGKIRMPVITTKEDLHEATEHLM